MQRRTQSVLGVATLLLVGSAALADAPRRSVDPNRGNVKVVPTEVGTVSTNLADPPVPDSSYSQSRSRMMRRYGAPTQKECDQKSALSSLGRLFGVDLDLACADQR